MVGPEARGVWIDLLCVMMESDPYGHLAVKNRPMTDEEAARLIGVDCTTFKGILYRLEEAGIPSRTPDGMLYSRRLVRDHERFITGSNAGHKGGGSPLLKKKPEEARSQKPEAKGGLKDAFKGVLPVLAFDSPAFAAAWDDWQTHRREIKKPLTAKSAEMQMNQFREWGQDRAIKAIRHTIAKGWQGIREEDTGRAAKPAAQSFRNQQAEPIPPHLQWGAK
jgi:hypothetical protein